MDYLNPIYTETTTCQDCYKCLRECTVKAIQIEKSCARILPEECTLCGHCVAVCPVGAKKVRDDKGRLKTLRARPGPMIALIAPSWVCEYPDLDLAGLSTRLAGLGFSQVVEVSRGAAVANQLYARRIKQDGGSNSIYIASACPTIVSYLKRYHPDLAGSIMPVESPLELTARMVKDSSDWNCSCVFFGPCIAKKTESDRQRELLDLALTWQDLDSLLGLAAGSSPAETSLAGNPGSLKEEGPGIGSPRVTARSPAPTVDGRVTVDGSLAREGQAFAGDQKAHLYPIDGGMTSGLRQLMEKDELDTMVFSGMVHVRQALQGLAGTRLERPLFLELLACEGGCVNGPQARASGGTITKRLRILENRFRGFSDSWTGQTGIREPRSTPKEVCYLCPPGDGPGRPGLPKSITDEEIRQSLARIGKQQSKDELNCSACGYDSCRDFARACLGGKAESSMCVSWMRNLVKKKADALLAAMPSGVVILDNSLHIVESNRNFARMMGAETLELFDLHPGLAGADARHILPRPDLFRQVLDEPGQPLEEDLPWNDRILHCHIFGIEPGQVAGGLFQDVTVPTVQRDRIIQQAQEVIEKHLGVVQQIAWLLGENAAESESILNSIIKSFSPPARGDARPAGQTGGPS